MDITNYENLSKNLQYDYLVYFRCYTIEAAMEFFGVENISDTPTKNRPNFAFIANKEYKQRYFEETLNKFIDQFVLGDDDYVPTNYGDTTDCSARVEAAEVDYLRYYSRNVLQYFFVLEDYRDAVREGDGKRMAQIHKDYLLYFKTDRSFNAYAIEMMVNVAQNEILLSEEEAHQAIWSQTVNWKGGEGKNVEADLMQENRNNDHKAGIRQMGANKTRKSVERTTKASGGKRKIVENFDDITKITSQSGSHTHKSSDRDEMLISQDLRKLRPFQNIPGRCHPSFPIRHAHPLEKVDFVELHAWLRGHMHNISNM